MSPTIKMYSTAPWPRERMRRDARWWVMSFSTIGLFNGLDGLLGLGGDFFLESDDAFLEANVLFVGFTNEIVEVFVVLVDEVAEDSAGDDQ